MKRLFLALTLFSSACATSFVGDAHFPGGAQSCRSTCERDGLEMSGFVYSGEYSTSCVCRPRRPPGVAQQGPLPPGWTAPAAATDDATEVDPASVVGVIDQTRRRILK